MLRVTSSSDVKDCTLQVGDYVPISFRCAEAASLTPFYWRTGDFKKSLLEVGLNQNTGVICKVTVTLIGNYSRAEVEYSTEAITVHHGLPTCEISDWPKDRFKDEPFTFATLIGEDSVAIWVAPEAPLSSIYEIGQVCFGTDREGCLRLLRFKDLSRFNLDRMIQTVS
jgi:hypothetical protein